MDEGIKVIISKSNLIINDFNKNSIKDCVCVEINNNTNSEIQYNVYFKNNHSEVINLKYFANNKENGIRDGESVKDFLNRKLNKTINANESIVEYYFVEHISDNIIQAIASINGRLEYKSEFLQIDD
jgi:hypothetical protein